ncbi:MAG: Alanine--tRNA ligase [Firmicutes bacterium]|nr:Alanine--tRNA ligase [Bacillota bacterium]
MRFQTANELRSSFLDFFRSKGHAVLPSASLVPVDDPTLLWINSGVATLKPYFSGQQVPPNPRLANSQKSIRTNDIENVGRTARHHTLFEMLGNFSIGDYFKEEAIVWAYEYMTGIVGFSPESLWISVHPEDEEALSLWREKVGVPAERIVKLQDNFWDIGPGPCGPNSEIYYDRGSKYACENPKCAPGCDCERYLEVWNLVFSQYNHNEDGTYTPLPRKNIDTGMGLERLASVVQGADTNYGTDLFLPYIRHVEKLTGRSYSGHQMAINVIADHVRAISFAIADGAVPANEGRGYVIRRLLRRAVRFGGQLGLKRPFLCDMVPLVAGVMSQAYPELSEKQDYVSRIVRREEERFLETLDEGTQLFLHLARELAAAGAKELSGEQAFRLYDTFGFPLDLTTDLAREHGLTVDSDGFAKAMEEQRQRARSARLDVGSDFGKVNYFAALPPTRFTGLEGTGGEATVVGLLIDGKPTEVLSPGEGGAVLLDCTPFYAESGGQVGDRGHIRFKGGEFRVEDTQKYFGDFCLHVGELTHGTLSLGDFVSADVDNALRQALARAHTATHLLHAALRRVLGSHVQQAGSLVEPDRLRFDFSHFTALTQDELAAIEAEINAHILASLPVESAYMTLEDAKAGGATALFGEKYGSEVRVVRMGEVTSELCGGTHLATTSAVGLCLLLSEGGIGAGLRRIEAVSGREAYLHAKGRLSLLDTLIHTLKTKPDEAQRRLESVLEQGKEAAKDAERLHAKLASLAAADFVAGADEVAGIKVVACQVQAKDVDALRAVADAVRDKLPSGVAVLGAVQEDKVALIAMVSEDLLAHGLHAGNLIREVAKLTGGGGGGKPTMAQAGGKDPSRLPAALKAVVTLVAAQLRM